MQALPVSRLPTAVPRWEHPPPADIPTELFGDSRLTQAQRAAGYVNDASGLTLVRPAAVVRPRTTDDIRSAFAVARAQGIQVTVAGTRHAGGGQALQGGALLLDMRDMAGMRYDPKRQTVTVRPGATWADVQRYLDPKGRSVQVMQSSNIFSVGGSIATNVHGRDVRFGPLGETVEGLRVLLPDGRELSASRHENADLFHSVVGGYGQAGVITEATLHTAPNEQMRRSVRSLPVKGLGKALDAVLDDPSLRMLQVRLPTSQRRMFDTAYALSTHALAGAPVAPLQQQGATMFDRAAAGAFDLARRSDIGKDALWQAQRLTSALANGKEVSRNQDMSPATEFLRGTPDGEAQVLQEYFVPRAGLDGFLGALRSAAIDNRANLLNITLRRVQADTTSILPYASTDSWAAVLYLNQAAGPDAQGRMDAFARDATDAALQFGGRPYLPYRVDAFTAFQLDRAHPALRSLDAAQRRYDPNDLLGGSIGTLAAKAAARGAASISA